MDVEDEKCNGLLELEKQLGVALITYRRRKRERSSADAVQVGVQDPCENNSCTGTSRSEWHDRIIGHWKIVIEQQLKLSYIEPGLGIWKVLRDALSLGHSQLPQKLMMNDVISDNDQLKDTHLGDSEVKTQYRKLSCFKTAKERTVEESKTSYYEEDTNTRKCEKAFLEILISDKFAMLCDFLLENFEGNKAEFFLDFSLIDSKMKNGVYEQSPELFDHDIQQIWNKVQKVGQEMTILATSLSSLPSATYHKQVLEDLLNANDQPKREVTCQEGNGKKNSAGSHATIQFTCSGSGCSTKPDRKEASELYKASDCKKCGTEANGECSLICDGCEAIYHFSCIEPAIKEIPTCSWYCAACTSNNKDSADPARSGDKKGSLHQNCVVCDRLEVSEMLEDLDENDSSIRVDIDSGASSVSSMKSDEPPELSRTAISCLCKICGTCEDEDKKFIVCGHAHCPYKFYHIRCLKSNQIASPQQQSRQYWYCPSCLCRVCLCDKDDNKIVLCDGCDEAYHTYCMRPPRTTVPKGQWYCVPCNVARAREGMKRYEQWILQQHRKNEGRQSNEGIGSMDLLISAAEKLRSEERSATKQ
ncbi:PHD finger protein EHD3-like [Canna indica]|uniref:PHD finger protein EHD3-like n=1 Tax=Canna indica TaxID=4628 RepID=A0AAQ3QQQ4_9LILI|nr:PHD finger protein EHD3-like [Canna indica]